MFKSLLAALVLAAALFTSPAANAQRASVLAGCDNSGCLYYIYQWQPAPGGGGEWVIVSCEWVPGDQVEAMEPTDP